MQWTWIAAAALAAVAGGISAVGALRWRRATGRLVARLQAAQLAPRTTHYDARELEGLPPPVQRYFRAVLADGAPIVSGAVVAHRGSFNLGESGARWKPFVSTQQVVTSRPGFVWDARIAVAPLLRVHVHDAYVAGEGLLHAALFGAFPIAALRGAGDIAAGELLRFFAEAAWYPTALLPSQGVRWEAVDERSARATLSDRALALSALFRFDAAGLIASVFSEARGRAVGGRIVPTPWEGRFFSYQRRDGMLVPLDGEVAWLLPEGRQPYWRGTITSLAYAFAGTGVGRR